MYTASIIHELNRFQTQEELLAFRFSREEDAGILLVDCMLHKACILIRSGMGSVFQNWQKSMNISVSQPIFTWVEWGLFDEAAGLLLQSIGICEKHLEITAYARRQLDLLEHLAEVYHFGRHDEKCQAVLTLLETKISKMNALETLD